MGIESIVCKDGFRVRFSWKAGVWGTVVYSVPKGSELPPAEEIMDAAQNGGLDRWDAFNYKHGITSVVYTPRKESMQAAWVDICCLDYDQDERPISNQRVQTCFNGVCRVRFRIDLIPISKQRRAVKITVCNKSKFPIEANGIGYTVGGRVYGIPVRLEENKRTALPQFDIDQNETVKLCKLDGGYPAEFLGMADGE